MDFSSSQERTIAGTEVDAMVAAVFALIGTLLGILGTLAVELVRGRTENMHARQQMLQVACADFVASVSRVLSLAIDVERNPGDAELTSLLYDAHREARVHYERLRLVAVSRDTQESGRHVLRYAYGRLRQAKGKPPREDERERGPLMMLHDNLMRLYAEVRREMGVPHADEVYREPDEWVGPSGSVPVGGDASSASARESATGNGC
jgi:hypothetical protein